MRSLDYVWNPLHAPLASRAHAAGKINAMTGALRSNAFDDVGVNLHTHLLHTDDLIG